MALTRAADVDVRGGNVHLTVHRPLTYKEALTLADALTQAVRDHAWPGEQVELRPT
ncbi:MAG TPA: hypothetical protein VFB25_10840 [Gaiellaceae bacterium]|nr:hypothetical protein [Gaiellaceae bacterium]